MKELRQILGEYRKIREAGERAVLASVVRVQGSAYRGPGARMLMTSEGKAWGFLSGGCLEADVREKAEPVMQSGRAELARYDMTSPDDILWGLGMGCDGIVDVLIECLPPRTEADSLLFLGECLAQGRSAAVGTVFSSTADIPLGSRLMLDESGASRSDIEDPALHQQLLQAARKCLQDGATFHHSVEVGPGRAEVLIEHLAPPTELLVCGAGYDAAPLVHFASQLGWSVTLTDHRPSLATSENFPEAERIVALHPPEAARQIALHGRMAAVVMTHNFPKDVEWLRWLLPSPLPYIGMLGPKARLDRLLKDLAEQGEELKPSRLQRLYGPVGLDIGASTPEEIALAILAEIRAVLSRRPAGFLKDQDGHIHERDDAPQRRRGHSASLKA